MSAQVQYGVAWGVAIVLSLFGAIQLAGGDALGISPRGMAWIGVATSVFGVLAGLLPKLQTPPKN